MAFFRKWKTHYKHKKFSSDDVIDSEDWGLGGSSTFGNAGKLDLGVGGAVEAINDLGVEFSDSTDEKLFASYDNLKYLGCTPIATKPNEKVTAEAIALVIANSKAGGRKTKTQKRITLNVSNEGVELIDQQTRDSLMRYSIYKISYCSVDAAHDAAFSFVGAERDPLSETDEERLSCHVFLCPKRKVAHEITLMVARCFERAYQLWREAVLLQQRRHSKNKSGSMTSIGNSSSSASSQTLKQRTGTIIESRAEVHDRPTPPRQELLIDLAATDTDVRKYLQNTWVSFDDDSAVQVAAC